MYLPDLSDIGNLHPAITTLTLFDTSRFTLGVSGVLGFFGGDEAISAIASVHVYRGRRWLGWYNTPGSYYIAKRYGLATTSTFFKSLFPGVHTDPARVFEYSGWHGPRFHGTYFGTVLDSTGHLASVLMKECASLDEIEASRRRDGPGTTVSIVTVDTAPPAEVTISRSTTYSLLLAIFPITASVGACIISGLFKDWFSFVAILFGIVSNGLFCLVVGSGTIHFIHHNPAPGSPPGDGILSSGREFVLLRGEEGAVNSITGGKFTLKLGGKAGGGWIGCCSVLFILQFITQLFLIPQASLLGQIMFISSFAVSWIYNMWLATFDKERVQRRILLDTVLRLDKKPSKYIFNTRTSAVVFALCVLRDQLVEPKNRIRLPRRRVAGDSQPNGDRSPPSAGTTSVSSHFPTTAPSMSPLAPPATPSCPSASTPTFVTPPSLHHSTPVSDLPYPSQDDLLNVVRKFLDAYLPNDTQVWKSWKGTLVEQLCKTGVLSSRDKDWGLSVSGDDRGFLFETLKNDALAAYEYYRDELPAN